MRGFAILLAFQVAGTFFEEVVHLPMPGNVVGLLLFLAALSLGWVKLHWVEQTASWLLKHMMLFFAPFVVGTIVFFPLLSREWAAVLLPVVVSTVLIIAVTGWTAKKMDGGRSSLQEIDESVQPKEVR